MKAAYKTIIVVTWLLSTLTISHAQFSGFDSGNLVILQDGNGSGTLSSAGAAIYLDQYTTSGSFVNDLTIPSTGSDELVNSGTATSEGQLSLSANDAYLVFAGYNVAAGATKVASSTSSADPRGIATVDANGNYVLATTSTSFYSANNIRGGTSDGNGNFWGAGPGGTVYMGTGTPAQISSSNSLAVQDIGGNLFYSTGKGTTGIYEISGAPTSGTASPSFVLANSSPSDFAFNTSMTVAYVANTSGGIQRYDFSGGSWTLSYTLDSGAGMNGLVVNFSTADPEIYATTEDGTQLIEITDSGSGSTVNTLATVDGTTEAFRGLEFAPVPEPSTFAMLGLGAMVVSSFYRKKEIS